MLVPAARRRRGEQLTGVEGERLGKGDYILLASPAHNRNRVRIAPPALLSAVSLPAGIEPRDGIAENSRLKHNLFPTP